MKKTPSTSFKKGSKLIIHDSKEPNLPTELSKSPKILY